MKHLKLSSQMFNKSPFFIALFMLLIYTCISSCGNEAGSPDDYRNMDSTEIVKEIETIRKSITDNRFDTENGILFNQIADIQYYNNDYKEAATNYLWAIQADPGLSKKKSIIHTLVEIASEHLKDKTVADMFRMAFAEAYPDEAQSEIYRNSLPGVDSLGTLLKVFMKNMNRSEDGVDDPIANRIIDGSEIYASVLNDKKDTPEIIQQAALILQTKHAVNKALSFYDWVISKYPESEHAPNALFMKAFTFDDIIRDTSKARKNYELFMQRYPEHDFAPQAQILIDNLGKEFQIPKG